MVRAYIVTPRRLPQLIYSGTDERFAHMAVRRFIGGARGLRGYIESDGGTIWYQSDWMPDDAEYYAY
jgi:hypothetical protein